jgi:hypothetical protein
VKTTEQHGNSDHVEDEITSLDDLPDVARVARRQKFLNRWYKPVALAPFVVVLILSLKIFPKVNEQVFFWPMMAALLWAMGIAAYSFYLLFWFKCPRCHERFGLGEACRNCDLARHRNVSLNIEPTEEQA